MTVNIVHWKNIVRAEFMERFTRIARAQCYADASSRHKVLAQVEDADIKHEYVRTCERMRCCGYEINKQVVRWHGWYGPYLEKNELRFTTTAPPESRHYIGVEEFMQFKVGCEKGTAEALRDDEERRRMGEEEENEAPDPAGADPVEDRDSLSPFSSCCEAPEPP